MTKVLIVDDDPNINELVKIYLKLMVLIHHV